MEEDGERGEWESALLETNAILVMRKLVLAA
jgi:hypothetical protein